MKYFDSLTIEEISQALNIPIGTVKSRINKALRLPEHSGQPVRSPSCETRSAAIVGSPALYLDFINLFGFLLRFLGGRRN